MPITEGGRFSPTSNIVSPGVFTRENDLSGIAQGVADIGGAIVAPFPKGPAFTPTLVRSVTELEEKFGVADGVFYGPYTAKEYLTERGLVTVCRVGALTGYKQNYPFVLWAVKGTYNRNIAVGDLDNTKTYINPTTAATNYVGEIAYIPASSGSLAHATTTASITVLAGTANSDIVGFNGPTDANSYRVTPVDYFDVEGSGSNVKQSTQPTYSYINVSWSALPYIKGYNVYRTTITNPSIYKKVNSSLVTTTTFKDYKSYIGTGTTLPTPSAMFGYNTATNSGSYSFNVPVVLTLGSIAFDANLVTGLGSNSGSATYSGQTLLVNLVASVTSSATWMTYISSSIQGQVDVTPEQKLTAAIASGSWSGSFGVNGTTAPTLVDTTGNYTMINGARLISGSWSMITNGCGKVISLQGLLSGSFGIYNGTFTPDGTISYDICTNTWSSSNSPDSRVLAVLADTQNATITDLVAPGFMGSTFTTASIGLTIGNDYAVSLKPSTGTSIYGKYDFSFDQASPKYITNVFGTDPTAGKPPTPTGQKIEAAYLYKVFENQIGVVTSDIEHWWISGSHLPVEDSQLWKGNPLDFTDDYSRQLTKGDSSFSITHATTPWIVSQAVAAWEGSAGGSTETRFRLFKAHTLADGTDTNTSYKVEISNVKLAGQVAGSDWGTFTLTVRKFSDTDKKPVILETFQNLNLDPDSSNFVARRIGDRYNYINFAGKIIEFGTYTNLSKVIRIEMATTPWATTAVPAGFEALITPINSSMGQWTVPIRYTRASIYGVDPGKYPSGIAFNDAPTGADAELSALYPVSSVGNGVADDNIQYFAPIPAFEAYSSVGRNTTFALDQTIDAWGDYGAPTTTGTFLSPSLSGSVPYIYESSVTEPTYVKMRKFVVGFQGGFDGQSPAIPISVGSDISPGNTQGLDCTNITTAGSVAYKQCIGALGNADEFDINLIATPGIVHQHHPYITNMVIDMCERRGDCFYIMDLHVTPETEGSTGQIDEVVYYATAYDTSYAAAYYPWIKILDTNTNKIIRVPPSVVLPAVFAANDKTAAEWFAPAGLNRGGITQAIQVCDRTTHEERDTLYEGKVNPIAAFPGQGICVWGQKTLQNKASALDRVNVRRLLINIKKFVASTSKYLVFEQNVAATRNKFLAIINPYLESIQQRSGLYAFQVVMDDTNNTADLIDRNILYGQFWLKPTKTCEFIIQDFNILPTGASFPNG